MRSFLELVLRCISFVICWYIFDKLVNLKVIPSTFTSQDYFTAQALISIPVIVILWALEEYIRGKLHKF